MHTSNIATATVVSDYPPTSHTIEMLARQCFVNAFEIKDEKWRSSCSISEDGVNKDGFAWKGTFNGTLREDDDQEAQIAFGEADLRKGTSGRLSMTMYWKLASSR
jgi:hypothetical protein